MAKSTFFNSFRNSWRRGLLLTVIICLTRLMSFGQQQSINCYPDPLDFWTGTCSNSAKTDNSTVKIYSQNLLRGWYMFNTTQIPDNATIDSIKLYFYVTSASGNVPYFLIKSMLSVDPVSSPANGIWSAIETGSAYETFNSYATLGWNSILISDQGSAANGDLMSKLPSNIFLMGVMTTNSFPNRYIYAGGQAETTYKPYIRVTFTPNYRNDAGIDSIVSPTTLSCEGEYPIIVKLRNFGKNPITKVKIDWSVGGIPQGPQHVWTGNLASGASTYVTLDPSYLFPMGSIPISAITSFPNDTIDPNPGNNSKAPYLQFIQKPIFVNQPIDKTVTIGGTTTFHAVVSPVGTNYQWELSTDAGANWTILTNSPPYSNVTTLEMTVTNAQQFMNGYLFRCRGIGICLPNALSNTAMLIVGNPVKSKIGPGFGCNNGTTAVPLNIQNINTVYDFTLTINFPTSILTYTSYSNLNSVLGSGGTFTVTPNTGKVTIHWVSSGSPITVSDLKVCDLNFAYTSGTAILSFDSLTSGACVFHGQNSISYASHYANGTVSIGTPNYITGSGPVATLKTPGEPAVFYSKWGGLNTYQWQISTNGGTVFTDLNNIYPYSTVNADTLHITDCSLGMNTYKYRLKVTGCGVTDYSDSAILNVQKRIKIWIDTAYACPGTNPVILNVKTQNFDSVGGINFHVWFQTDLIYVGYQNVNPSVEWFSCNENPAAPGWRKFLFAGVSAVNPMSIPDNGTFMQLKFNYTTDSSILKFDTWSGNSMVWDIESMPITTDWLPGYILSSAPVVVTNPPANITIYAGSGTTITATGSGYNGVTYQWQLSTNGGSSWADLTNTLPYSGVTTTTLTISSSTLAMNGYKYRLKVIGLCTPAFSTATTLTVDPPPIYVDPGQISACFGDSILIPINVLNFNGVCNFSMKLVYNSTKLYYDGFQNINSGLSYPNNLLINTSPAGGDTIIFSWYSSVPVLPANIGNGILVKLRFFALQSFSAIPLTWKTTKPGFCEIKDCTLPSPTSKATTWVNGTISVNARPTSYLVITPQPANGHYCAGGIGIQIGLSNSTFGVNYALYRNGVLVPFMGGVAGVNAPIVFGTFTQAGEYTVVATNTISNCSKLMDGSVTIVIDPPPTIYNMTGGGHYCTGTSGAPIGLNGSQIGIEYFLLKDGSPIDTLMGTGSALSFGNQTLAGVYTIYGYYAQTKTCQTTMNPMTGLTIVIDPLPAAAGTIVTPPHPNPFCQGENAVSFSVPLIDNATSYVWSFPAGVTVINGSGTHAVVVNFTVTATPGPGVVTVKGHNNCGDGTLSTLNIIINPKPGDPSPITTNPAPPFCQGQTGIVLSTSISNVTATGYVWSFPTGMSIQVPSPSNTATVTVSIATGAPGSGNITVRGNNDCGLGNILTLPITTNLLPSAAGTINGPASPCQGANGIIYSIATVPNCSTYVWNVPTGYTIASQNNNSITLNVSTTAAAGQLTVTPQNGCGNGPTSPIFNINPIPLPGAAGAISGPIAVCKGSNGNSYSVPSIPNANSGYVWTYSGSGATISGNTNPVIINFSGTASSGTLSVKGQNGCGFGASSNLSITVNASPSIVFPSLGTICYDAPPLTLSTATPPSGTYSGPGVVAGQFFPSTAGVGPKTITYNYTDPVTLCSGSGQSTITVEYRPKITGTLKYDYLLTPYGMGNVRIYLKTLAGVKLDSVQSAASTGAYEFRCLSSNSYRIEPRDDKAWGGVNATDALAAAKYSVGLITLTPFRIRAADVNATATINGADALLIMKRQVGQISTFLPLVPDWLYDSITNPLVINTGNITHNIKALCAGDVMGDYLLAAKVAPSVRMENSGYLDMTDNKWTEIPVRVKNDVSMSAMTLVLDFPADQIEVRSLRSNLKDLVYQIHEGQVRIAWYRLEPVEFKAGETLLNLKVRLKAKADWQHLPSITPGAECEFADERIHVIDPVVITIPEMRPGGITEPTTIEQVKECYLGANRPNPFDKLTHIEYGLPEECKVRISIFNLLGEEIKVLVDSRQPSGIYQAEFDGSSLSPGVYLYKMEAEGSLTSFMKTRTMIIKD